MPIPVIVRVPPLRLSFCALLIASTIVGCSSLAQPGNPVPAAKDPATAPDDAPKALPEVGLTAGLLYQIMAAEVAQQRGDAGASVATFLLLARQTRDPRLARRATEIAIENRLNAQALEGARLWAQLAPQSAEAAYALGSLQTATGKLTEARAFWEQRLKSASDPIGELAQLQQALPKGSLEAFAFFESLATPYLSTPGRGADARLILATAAANAGLSARAMQEARTAAKLDPDSQRTQLIAAQTMIRAGGTDKSDASGSRAEALKLVEDFLQRKPDSNEARLALARLLIAANRLPEARTQLDELLRRDPGNPDALYARGVLALDGKPPRTEARAFFERYLEAVKSSPVALDPDGAYLNLARIAEDERKYDEALKWLEQVDDGDQYLAARTREAFILAKRKQLDAALKLLEDTAAQPQRTAEERSSLIVAQGQLLREAKRYQASFDLLNTALSKAPDDANLLYDTAMAAEKLDLLDMMEKHLRRVMELKPQDAHSYNALGYSLADRNLRLDEAQQLISRALQLAPDDGYILDSMGWVLFRRGQLADARGYLERAWTSRPESEVGAHLGEVLWQMGEQDGARRVWREAIALDPESDLVQTTLARLKVKL